MRIHTIKKVFFMMLAILVPMLPSVPANALIIDFEEISLYSSGNSLDSQGFNFSNDCSNTLQCIIHLTKDNPFNADPGGVTFAHAEASSTTVLTHISGASFDFDSIDFSDFFNNIVPQNIEVTGVYALGGMVSQIITLAPVTGLETFIFNWDGLIQVSWTETSNNWLQLDNVVVHEIVPQLQAANHIIDVSAPPAMALLGFGLFGFAAMRKRLYEPR